MKRTKMLRPKKINVDKASDNVAKIGADITAGSFLNLIATRGIIVPKNLAKITTKNSDNELAKITNERTPQLAVLPSLSLNDGIAK